VAQFFLLCYREWSSAGRDNEVISTTGETVVRLLREYIDQHFNESLGLQQLSRRAGYAPSYLSSLFSKANGQGLSEYISRKRIAGAQHLLKSSDLKVVDICYRVGFKDLAHFNRTFKRFVGIPPNQYRRSCAGPNARRERSSGMAFAAGLRAMTA
jgi:two-component system response regulator YesN